MNRIERDEASIRTHLSRVSDTNRLLVEKYLQRSRLNDQNALNTLRMKATYLEELDRETGGAPLGTLGEADLTSWLEAITLQDGSPQTVATKVRIVRAFFNWHYDKQVPRPVERALETRIDRVSFTTPVITETEWAQLLGSSASFRTKTLLVTLFDSGMRASEFCALNVGSLRFLDENRVRIRIPDDAGYLKTGPREICISQATGRLRQLLRIHRDGGNPEAPLFYSQSPKSLGRRLEYWGLSSALKNACKTAGTRRLNPHLFRHSRATAMADSEAVNEPMMRMFFGWSARSCMPTRYIHMSTTRLDRLAQMEHDRREATQLAAAQGVVAPKKPDLLTEVVATQARIADLLTRLADPNTQAARRGALHPRDE